MIVQFNFRRGTAADWIAENPILGDGEPAYDTTNKTLRIGDGVSHYSALSPITGGGGGGGLSSLAWTDVTGKPATFPPTAHQHSTTDIAGFTEAVQDIVGTLIAAGSGVTAVYDDTAGSLVISATGGGGGGGSTDPEVVRDTIGAALQGSGLITVFYNDALDTLTVSTSATANSTDAALRDRTTHTGVMPLAGAPAGSILVAPLNGTINTNAAMARPSTRTDIFFVWRSTVQPTNMIAGDDWWVAP